MLDLKKDANLKQPPRSCVAFWSFRRRAANYDIAGKAKGGQPASVPTPLAPTPDSRRWLR